MQRFWVRSRVAGWVCALIALPAGAGAGVPSGATSPHPAPVESAAEPGAWCAIGGCRPQGASPWSGAAFGAAVLAAGWQARRRPRARA